MGFFSWKTCDTGKSIANTHSRKKTFTVYMVAPIDGYDAYTVFKETDYNGYGEFGGKDYYELLAEINGLVGDDLRSLGITLSFSPEKFNDELNGREIVYPQLFSKIPGRGIDFSTPPVSCEYQGFFY